MSAPRHKNSHKLINPTAQCWLQPRKGRKQWVRDWDRAWFFTVESLSLLYLLFIYRFIGSKRWCIDKLGVFHPNKHIRVLIHIWTIGEVRALWNLFKPSSKKFYWPFQGGNSFVDHLCYFCLVFVIISCMSVCWCLVVTCWKRADLLALFRDV